MWACPLYAMNNNDQLISGVAALHNFFWNTYTVILIIRLILHNTLYIYIVKYKQVLNILKLRILVTIYSQQLPYCVSSYKHIYEFYKRKASSQQGWRSDSWIRSNYLQFHQGTYIPNLGRIIWNMHSKKIGWRNFFELNLICSWN